VKSVLVTVPTETLAIVAAASFSSPRSKSSMRRFRIPGCSVFGRLFTAYPAVTAHVMAVVTSTPIDFAASLIEVPSARSMKIKRSRRGSPSGPDGLLVLTSRSTSTSVSEPINAYAARNDCTSPNSQFTTIRCQSGCPPERDKSNARRSCPRASSSVVLIPIVRDHSVQFDVITCSDSS